MATLSALVKVVANVEALDDVQVGWTARYLREAGLLSQGGRGKGGARMNSRDAANLLIGVNAAGRAADAVPVVKAYSALIMTGDMSDAPYAASGDMRAAGTTDELWDGIMMKGCTFGDAFTRMIDACIPAEGQEPALVLNNAGPGRLIFTLEFQRPRPEILIEGESAPGHGHQFEDEEIPRLELYARFTTTAPRPVGVGDRRDRTSISSKTLLAVGRALAA